MTTLQQNSIFANRYRIERIIASGGMGSVYEVVHIETERRRALKVMHPHIVQSVELRDRFKREAKVAAAIDSEFIVDVFDAGVDDATEMPFLVMELLKGEELGKRLARIGRFAPPDAITYLWQTALALEKTHRANVVHRDLKPDNLFLTQREDGVPRIKVLDFGVAKFVAETGTTAGATRSLGTPLYMSPEQFRAQKVTAASDIYALALMAYTLIVGEAYWAADTTSDMNVIAFSMKAVYGPKEAPTVRALRCGITLPAAFDEWFRHSTAVDPAARTSSAVACIAALGEVFGLNPARISGVASSDPLPTMGAEMTASMGSGLFGRGIVSGPSSPQVPVAQPPSGVSASGTVAMPSSPPGPPPQGVHATVNAVALGQVVQPQRKSATLPLLLLAATLVIGGIVGGVLFLGTRSVSSAKSPATSSAKPSDVQPATSRSVSSASVATDSGPSPTSSAPSSASSASMSSEPQTPESAKPLAAVPALPIHPAPPVTNVKPVVPAKPAANCDPNYYLDSDGQKHFKPECFK